MWLFLFDFIEMHSRAIYAVWLDCWVRVCVCFFFLYKMSRFVSESTIVFWKRTIWIIEWLWLQQCGRMNDVTVNWCHSVHFWSFEGAVCKTTGNTCIFYDGRIECFNWNGLEKLDARCCQCASNNGKQTKNNLKIVNRNIWFKSLIHFHFRPYLHFSLNNWKTWVSTWMDTRTIMFFRSNYWLLLYQKSANSFIYQTTHGPNRQYGGRIYRTGSASAEVEQEYRVYRHCPSNGNISTDK